jgi:ABC-type sulfate transport system permease subunit
MLGTSKWVLPHAVTMPKIRTKLAWGKQWVEQGGRRGRFGGGGGQGG